MTLDLDRIDRRSGLAVWRQIAERLEWEIVEGRLGPGDKLPTEQALAARFGVNRHTVRQAVARLAESGRIRVEQGRGMFVHEQPLDYVLSSRTRFTENVQAGHRRPTRDLLEAVEEPASATIAAALGLSDGEPVWRLETLNRADGRPVGIASHYFPKSRFPDMPAAYRSAGSITGALRKLGLPDYKRRKTRISAALVSAADARHLGIPRQRAVLITENVNVDPDGKPIEFGRARMVAEYISLSVEH